MDKIYKLTISTLPSCRCGGVFGSSGPAAALWCICLKLNGGSVQQAAQNTRQQHTARQRMKWWKWNNSVRVARNQRPLRRNSTDVLTVMTMIILSTRERWRLAKTHARSRALRILQQQRFTHVLVCRVVCCMLLDALPFNIFELYFFSVIF